MSEIDKLKKGQWQLLNDKIVFNHLDQIIEVSSSNIIKIEFKGKKEINGISIDKKPSESLNNINLNRFPLEIDVKLLIPEVKSDNPRVLLRTVISNHEIDLKEIPDSDQIIIGSDWFPLLKSDLDVIQQFFKEFEISSIGPLSLFKCIHIAKNASDIVEIISEDNAIDKSNFPEEDLDLTASLNNKGFNATLYDYQCTGVSWLNMISKEGLGCILADEMGLGKTIQIIALILLNNEKKQSPSMIVAPATLMENWRREIKKFAPSLKTLVHIGSDRTGFPSDIREYDIIITSYDTAVRDYSLLNMIKWSFFVIDEAQAIKNPDTLRASTLKLFGREVSIAVTGTPVENSLTDLWSIMDFCIEGFLGDQKYFENNYNDSVEDARRIEEIVSPLILRRTIDEVADYLPEKIIIPQPILLSEESARKYEGIRHEIESIYENNATLVALTKLRQYCAHPMLLDENVDSDPSTTSTKFLRLLELIDEIHLNCEKCVIFTSYHKMSDIISENLIRRFGFRCYQIDGRVQVNERQKIVDTFSKETDTSVLVLNPRAAGTGLNITSANHVIHYNLEWNPAVEDQATARVHRLGQKMPVTVHRLYHIYTVEEVINDRLSRKRDLSEGAIIGTEGSEEDMADIRHSIKKSPILKSQLS